mmetsp:Transcript_234/g.635  ORF Transcript_234/g.635 Transcript_234/m.635 type:complete len:620 (-) Transcript_234:65-1924(-)
MILRLHLESVAFAFLVSCKCSEGIEISRTLTSGRNLSNLVHVALKHTEPVPTTLEDALSSPNGELAISTFLAVCFLAFLITSALEVRRFVTVLRKPNNRKLTEVDEGAEGLEDQAQLQREETADLPNMWSLPGIVLLNGRIFYTGFMTSTWLPYLCAMDGSQMWRANQSLFMAYCKLIYGITVVFNPLYGVVADKAVSLSHGIGRRAFIRLGFFMATVGILICMLSSRGGEDYYYSYMLGVVVWRVGEALNDVTTEALPPEVVHDSQWQQAAAIKAGLFLAGGVLGYVMLIAFVDVDYSWLYWAYLILMFICGVPPLVLLDDDRPLASARTASQSMGRALLDAYVEPLRYDRGFPMACAALFIFSLGTAPMFFFLLIVRDLVQVNTAHDLQLQFCYASIMFFLSAALAAVSGPLCHVGQSGGAEDRSRRWNLLVMGIFLFSLISLVIPLVSQFSSQAMREEVLYLLAIAYGVCFGIAYGRFQDCTWQLLPDRSCGETATLMGFNNMCKLAGAGAGNFVAGLLLDQFALPTEPFTIQSLFPQTGKKGIFWTIYQYLLNMGVMKDQKVIPVYSVTGYVGLCVACAVLTGLSGIVTFMIPRPEVVGKDKEPRNSNCRTCTSQ